MNKKQMIFTAVMLLVAMSLSLAALWGAENLDDAEHPQETIVDIATPQVLVIVVTATPQPTAVASPIPDNKVVVAGSCNGCFDILIDRQPQSSNMTFWEAYNVCQAQGGSLPSELQLKTAVEAGLIAITADFEWTGEAFSANPVYQSWFQTNQNVDTLLVTVLTNQGKRAGEFYDNARLNLSFRCIYPL